MKELLLDEILMRDFKRDTSLQKDLQADEIKLRLLQGILRGFIAANPSATPSEKSRAKTAIKALLGKSPRGFHAGVTDEDLLRHMANLYVAENIKPGPKRGRLSADALAKQVAKENNTERGRIRKEFAYRQSQLVPSVENDDRAIDSIVRTALNDIETILTVFGIRFHAER